MSETTFDGPPTFTSFSLEDLIATKTATWAAYAPDGLRPTTSTPDNPLTAAQIEANRAYNRNVLVDVLLNVRPPNQDPLYLGSDDPQAQQYAFDIADNFLNRYEILEATNDDSGSVS